MSEPRYTDGAPGPCCKKIDDMIRYGRPMLQRWPPFFRYTLGEDILQEMYTMLRLATKARLKYMNKTTLADLDVSKAILDVLLRQANSITFADRGGNERRLLTDHTYGVWSGYIAEIGRLIGGWMQSVEGRKNTDKRT